MSMGSEHFKHRATEIIYALITGTYSEVEAIELLCEAREHSK